MARQPHLVREGALVHYARHRPEQTTLYRLGWARLLKRVCAFDLEHCPHCGGALKIIAAIVEPPVIERILTPLGLAARPPPPRAPARSQPLLRAA